MSRRRNVRRLRRIQVTFWKRGEAHGYPGYTTNISTTGMFVGTSHPFPPGTRVRIEVLDRDRGFMVEGVVAHARRIQGELSRLAQSGMGVRFLNVEQLVHELIPPGGGPALEPIPGPELEEGSPAPAEAPAAPAPPEPAAAPPSPPPVPAAAYPVAPPAPAPAASTASPHERVWTVRFASRRQFLQIFDRDLVHGGLFVATPQPARVQEVVTVEVHLPHPEAPVRLRARVVQRFEPQAAGGAPNLLAGMGVELLEPVAERLGPVAQRLRALPD